MRNRAAATPFDGRFKAWDKAERFGGSGGAGGRGGERAEADVERGGEGYRRHLYGGVCRSEVSERKNLEILVKRVEEVRVESL